MSKEQFAEIIAAFAKLNDVSIDEATELVYEIGDRHNMTEGGKVLAAGKEWIYPTGEE